MQLKLITLSLAGVIGFSGQAFAAWGVATDSNSIGVAPATTNTANSPWRIDDGKSAITNQVNTTATNPANPANSPWRIDDGSSAITNQVNTSQPTRGAWGVATDSSSIVTTNEQPTKGAWGVATNFNTVDKVLKEKDLSLFERQRLLNRTMQETGAYKEMKQGGRDISAQIYSNIHTLTPTKAGVLPTSALKPTNVNISELERTDPEFKKAAEKIRQAKEKDAQKLSAEINDNTMKMSDEEEFAGKAFMCLIGGAFKVSECRHPLRHYYKLLVRKPHKALGFLHKGPFFNGNSKRTEDKMTQKLNSQMQKATGSYDPIYDKIFAANRAITNDFIAQQDSDYNWANKPYNADVGGFGTYNFDGEVGRVNFYSCTADKNEVGNLNSRYEVFRYQVDSDPVRYEYRARVLTHLPKNCELMRNYFTLTQPILKYDAQKCNPSQTYHWADFQRGYYETTDDRGRTTRHNIPKDCWYEDENARKQMENAYAKAKSDILERAVKNKESSATINARLHNLNVQMMFPLVQSAERQQKQTKFLVQSPTK